jgi:hypothetical protein
MKIAVVGARAFPSREKVQTFVRFLPGDWEIVSGGAPGVDTFAQDAAAEQHRPYTVFYADWDRVGRAAGMIRNTQIANECDALVAFVHGPSKGTMDTVRKAGVAHKPIWVITVDDDLPTWQEIEAKVQDYQRRLRAFRSA